MPTRTYRLPPTGLDPAAIEAAARALRNGELVVFPTETVYGLAARADDPAAIARIHAAKGRDADKPLTLHLPDVAALESRFAPLSPAAARLVRRRLPGPLTLVLPDRTGGESTGVRVPDDPAAVAVLRAAGVPVVATSVNRSGEPPAVTGSGALEAARGHASVVLDGGPCRIGRSSTVVRLTGGHAEVLREGAIPAREVLEDAARILLFVCTGNLCRSPLAAALAGRDLARHFGVAPGEVPARGFALLSAGTAAGSGRPATPETLAEARLRGADLSGHRSRPLTPSLIDRADRVLVMEEAHRRTILEFAPDAARIVHLLRSDGTDVPDPYGRGREEYSRTADLIERAVADRLREEPVP